MLQREFEEHDQIRPSLDLDPGANRSEGASSQAAERDALREELRNLREELARLRANQEALHPSTAPTAQPESQPHESEHETQSARKPHRARSVVSNRVAAAILILSLALAAGFGGPRVLRYLGSYQSTDDAQIDGHIAPISSRVSGTVLRVYVENTQFVKAGQPLADIDPRDFQVAVEKARGDLAQAQAEVKSASQDYAAATASLAQSEATNVKAQRDAARYRVLLQSAVISRDEYEGRVRDAKVAAATVQSERAKEQGAARMISVREAAVQSAQAALDQAKLNLGYTKIVAPLSGVVGKKTVEVGARVEPGQSLLAVVPLDDLWVTANFKEDQLRRMHPGQTVTVHVDATGGDYRGYLEGMPAASGELFSLLPPENATGNYVKVVQRLPVRIRFYPGQDPDHRLRPGMSVEPTVWLG